MLGFFMRRSARWEFVGRWYHGEWHLEGLLKG